MSITGTVYKFSQSIDDVDIVSLAEATHNNWIKFGVIMVISLIITFIISVFIWKNELIDEFVESTILFFLSINFIVFVISWVVLILRLTEYDEQSWREKEMQQAEMSMIQPVEGLSLIHI